MQVPGSHHMHACPTAKAGKPLRRFSHSSRTIVRKTATAFHNSLLCPYLLRSRVDNKRGQINGQDICTLHCATIASYSTLSYAQSTFMSSVLVMHATVQGIARRVASQG